MSKALYRKYRSKSLDEVIGQSHITSVLKRSIEQGRISHAYLLTGPRGVGKTSIARILAHTINDLSYDDSSAHLDIIEIDAASNNGVEDVRDLREKAQIAPVSAAKKVYIIDEVHMLSKAAFNALLKTLEEPPEHIVFILATTDADKLPATIVSRTQQFGFRAISQKNIELQLGKIAKEEKITIDTEALALIARRGDGSFRDSISLLDQLASLSDDKQGITVDLVEQTLGLAPTEIIERLIEAYEDKNLSAIVSTLDESETLGIQGSILSTQLIEAIKQALPTRPHLLALLDDLLTVPVSSSPNIKLLTVLGHSSAPSPRINKQSSSAPLEATKQVTPTIIELERKAVQKVPKENPKPKLSKKTVSLETFDWTKVIEYTRSHHVAIYSVLVKCGYEVTNEGLTIFTINNFYKKKLDDSKYRPLLISTLEELGFKDIVIDTVPTASPLKDEQAAKVAAIMGGGEEVSIESNGN